MSKDSKPRASTIKVTCYLPEPYASQFRAMHREEIERELAGSDKPNVLTMDQYAGTLLRLAIDAVAEL